MHIISVSTRAKTEFLNVTSAVQDIITTNNIKSGTCFIFVPHTTAAITMNENTDPAVLTDLSREFARVAPQRTDFEHSEGNSPAHLASSLTGQSLFVFVESGKMVLGTW
jgi:secondary thiamine-phosphate synthase enzyme